MSCCGQKRSAVSSVQAHPELVKTRVEVASPLHPNIRYTGTGPLTLRGPRTGQVYFFAETGHIATVAEKDIEALLRTHLFVRESP
jgi:hypothetical protein